MINQGRSHGLNNSTVHPHRHPLLAMVGNHTGASFMARASRTPMPFAFRLYILPCLEVAVSPPEVLRNTDPAWSFAGHFPTPAATSRSYLEKCCTTPAGHNRVALYLTSRLRVSQPFQNVAGTRSLITEKTSAGWQYPLKSDPDLYRFVSDENCQTPLRSDLFETRLGLTDLKIRSGSAGFRLTSATSIAALSRMTGSSEPLTKLEKVVQVRYK